MTEEDTVETVRNLCLEPLDKKFLGYVGRSDILKHHIAGYARGAANQVRMPISGLKKCKIPVPPLPTQRRIAAILSAYDDLIENNLRRIRLLEEAAQLIYKEWFVYFRFPGWEGTAVVDGLPQGWQQGKVEDFLNVAGGGTPSTKVPEYWEGGAITWFSPTDLTKASSLILLDSDKKITKKGLQKSSARLLSEDHILMTSRATIGVFGLYDGSYTTNQGFINIKPRKSFHRYFLLYHFMNRVEEMKGVATGSTFLEISKKKFKALPVTMPTDGLLGHFHNTVSPIIDQLKVLNKQNQKLQEARDILLPRLMNGTIALEESGRDFESHPDLKPG